MVSPVEKQKPQRKQSCIRTNLCEQSRNHGATGWPKEGQRHTIWRRIFSGHAGPAGGSESPRVNGKRWRTRFYAQPRDPVYVQPSPKGREATGGER